MRALGVSVLAAMAITLGTHAAVAAIDCEPARCDPNTQAAISSCGCPDASNHGRYVSCVAHAVKALASSGAIPKNCKGKVVRCAARSTCGKPGFVVCKIPVYGTCDLATSTCTEGTSVLMDGTCAADTDCVVKTKCNIKSSEDRCLARGGTPDPTSTTCCAVCQ